MSTAVAVSGIALLAAGIAPQAEDAFARPLAPHAGAPVVTNADATESPTIRRINAVRRSHGLRPVRSSRATNATVRPSPIAA